MPRITSTLAAALLTCAISAHAQPAAPQGPGQSMLVLDASGYWGAATLLFDRERTQFQGYWDYCDRGGAAEGAWHGQLIGREPASAAK